MNSSIVFKKLGGDDDLIVLLIEVIDGRSVFANEVYIDIDAIEVLIKELSIFRENIHGGLYDIRFGAFGHEYANGGFHARLHFYDSGLLFISTYQQSAFEKFSNTQVASEAKIFLKTEPILLDNFISELKSLNSGANDEAILACV